MVRRFRADHDCCQFTEWISLVIVSIRCYPLIRQTRPQAEFRRLVNEKVHSSLSSLPCLIYESLIWFANWSPMFIVIGFLSLLHKYSRSRSHALYACAKLLGTLTLLQLNCGINFLQFFIFLVIFDRNLGLSLTRHNQLPIPQLHFSFMYYTQTVFTYPVLNRNFSDRKFQPFWLKLQHPVFNRNFVTKSGGSSIFESPSSSIAHLFITNPNGRVTVLENLNPYNREWLVNISDTSVAKRGTQQFPWYVSFTSSISATMHIIFQKQSRG